MRLGLTRIEHNALEIHVAVHVVVLVDGTAQVLSGVIHANPNHVKVALLVALTRTGQRQHLHLAR